MSLTYENARRDFEALEQRAELTDQVDLDAERLNLMRDPTQARAARMYESAIGLWFQEHGADFDSDPVVWEIKDRRL